MAKEDYLEGYGQGLKRGKEGPIMGPINKALDKALGNPHESARRGLDQGYDEMKKAKEAERIKKDEPDMSVKEILGKMVGKVAPSILKPITNSSDIAKAGYAPPKVTTKLKTGGTASSRADGCAVRGKTRA